PRREWRVARGGARVICCGWLGPLPPLATVVVGRRPTGGAHAKGAALQQLPAAAATAAARRDAPSEALPAGGVAGSTRGTEACRAQAPVVDAVLPAAPRADPRPRRRSVRGAARGAACGDRSTGARAHAGGHRRGGAAHARNQDAP